MVSYMDYTSPNAQYTFDINKSPLFRKDAHNRINVLGVDQLNTLENVSLLDIFLSAHNVVEPHYHQNAAELVYCISGAATVTMLNPFTKEILNFPITRGQVANVPQGWWHYEVATADHTHLLAIFDAPTPEVILGSDILKFTPANIMAHTYCMDEKQWEQTVAPVQPTTYIGPNNYCNKESNIAPSQPLIQQNNFSYTSPYNQQSYIPQQQYYWGNYCPD